MDEEELLRLEEVESVAAELDIDPVFVRRAVETLRERRAEAVRVQARDARERKTLVVMFAGGVGGLVVLGLTLLWLGHSGLNAHYARVEAARAQVVQVVERQKRIEARYAGQKFSPDQEAEVIGAENRVRVEVRRYDRAAASYNQYARGVAGSVARVLFEHPERVELSTGLDVFSRPFGRP